MQFNFLHINSFAFALCSLELMFMLMQFAFCSLEHIIVYILLYLCFVLIVVNQMQNGQKDLDFRTFPMLNGVKEQLGLMLLECYKRRKCQRATRPHAFRMLNLESWIERTPILNSLLSILSIALWNFLIYLFLHFPSIHFHILFVTSVCFSLCLLELFFMLMQCGICTHEPISV